MYLHGRKVRAASPAREGRSETTEESIARPQGPASNSTRAEAPDPRSPKGSSSTTGRDQQEAKPWGVL
jgi:hypothetical protein